MCIENNSGSRSLAISKQATPINKIGMHNILFIFYLPVKNITNAHPIEKANKNKVRNICNLVRNFRIRNLQKIYFLYYDTQR